MATTTPPVRQAGNNGERVQRGITPEREVGRGIGGGMSGAAVGGDARWSTRGKAVAVITGPQVSLRK